MTTLKDILRPGRTTTTDHKVMNHVASSPPGKSLMAELDAAVESQTVALEHLVLARYWAVNDKSESDLHEQYAAKVGELRRSYRAQINANSLQIVEEHICTHIPAAVTLLSRTSPQRSKSGHRLRRRLDQCVIDLAYLPEATIGTPADLEMCIWECKALYLQALQTRPHRRAQLINAAFSTLVHLLSVADGRAMQPPASGHVQTPDSGEKSLAYARQEVSRLRAAVRGAQTTEAQQAYILGTFAGILVILGVLYLLYSRAFGLVRARAIVGVFGTTSHEVFIYGLIGAGALGAIVSVMSRLTSGRLRIDPAAGTGLTSVSGMFRPVIGAIFGLVLYTAVEAQLLPIDIHLTGNALTNFYLALAFLAGFSERLAQDAVTRASGAVVPVSANPVAATDINASTSPTGSSQSGDAARMA